MELREGRIIAERFRLVRELGRGGMGAVWKAEHVGLEVPCAVKFILGDAAQHPEVRARFVREAKAAAMLRSPHVVQILDHGVCEETPYIAMELLEGEELGRRLERVGRLPPAETIAILAQVARALGKAHQAGLVHRDLKPDNVFLVKDDDREIVKVLDFGIAKSLKGDLAENYKTRTGALLGTPFYMSPEQAQGVKTIDHRSDLWSLAVIAFRCLTGRLPFESDALGDLLVKIIMAPLPVPTSIAPWLPPSVDAWWQRAAAREPADRFATAGELIEALASALGIAAPMRASEVPGGARVGAYDVTAPALTPSAERSGSTPAPAAPARREPSLNGGVSHTFGARDRRSRVGLTIAGVLSLALGGAVAFAVLYGVPGSTAGVAASASPVEEASAAPETTAPTVSAAAPEDPPPSTAANSVSAAAAPADESSSSRPSAKTLLRITFSRP